MDLEQVLVMDFSGHRLYQEVLVMILVGHRHSARRCLLWICEVTDSVPGGACYGLGRKQTLYQEVLFMDL